MNLVFKNNHPIFALPEIFPASWASDWGQDEYGLWMAFTFKGVRQCFRWIKPGRFMMGSPETEPERFDNEKQHEVIITEGVWLADTVCTQGLWSAVMGVNYSRFRSDSRPVENVSWYDSLEFIEKMNGIKPELKLRLPTEAEWEYSCRAGTTTPFSFGEDITIDQANYNGEYPYKRGRTRLNRKETITVIVKSFPCNAWGLFEMHGNVWEWCYDRYSNYFDGHAIDPEESLIEFKRVLRGGSWNNIAKHARSAKRNRQHPNNRNGTIGFRLAIGQ